LSAPASIDATVPNPEPFGSAADSQPGSGEAETEGDGSLVGVGVVLGRISGATTTKYTTATTPRHAATTEATMTRARRRLRRGKRSILMSL
jgi:hypothetical protein